MTIELSLPCRLLLGLVSTICLSASAVSQDVQSPPQAALPESTHPRMDYTHPWHLDLPKQLMDQGQFGTCLIRFQVDPDGGIRVAQVVRSTGFPKLDLACIHNILLQRLLPATDHGVRIAEWVAWPISMNAKTPPKSELKDTSSVPQIQQFYALKADLADYPAIAQAMRQYKDCRIRVWVTPDATVQKLEVTESTGFEILDQACRAAVQAAPFTPARHDGAATGAWAEITMRWNLP
jgi:TonB family protein